MTESSKSLHDQKIASVARELSEKGYKVKIEPSPNDIPFDLGNYKPDLVAFKEGGGIVLEVKESHTRLSVDRFQELARIISVHQGWRFQLLTLSDETESVLPTGQEDLPSWKALQHRLKEIEELVQNHLIEPALLYLWSTVEAILRRRAISQNLPIERFPAIRLLNHMYSSGEISISEFDLVKSTFEKRNRVAHGLVVTLDQTELEKLVIVTDSLIKKWQGSQG
jgi:hypothetical protein